VFFDVNPYEIVIEPHPQEPEHEVHKLRLTQPIPESFCSIAADAVHNIRSCLDTAVQQISIAAGRVKSDYMAFPFAGSLDKFESNMKGRSRDVPEDLYPLFRAFQPYQGGNDFLWALNKASNTDKHALLGVGIGSGLGNFLMTEGGLVSIPVRPPWDRLKNEVELGTYISGKRTKYKMDFTLFVTFDEIPVIDGEPVLDVLHHFVSIVESILGALEAESRRLGYIS
jgi:hypothetical protein